MHIFDEQKIDCHAHVIDPANFPYGRNVAYKPAGQEIGTTRQFREVMQCYGVTHALLVQPNSGYGNDNSCILDAIANGEGRFKGIAIVDLDADVETLQKFRARGVVGAAINPTFHGNDYYRHAESLMKRLAELDMFFNLQVENDQFLMYQPWIERVPVKVLIDHVGRPTPSAGLDQPSFAAMLRMAKTGRVNVKLSGYLKFSGLPYPLRIAGRSSRRWSTRSPLITACGHRTGHICGPPSGRTMGRWYGWPGTCFQRMPTAASFSGTRPIACSNLRSDQ